MPLRELALVELPRRFAADVFASSTSLEARVTSTRSTSVTRAQTLPGILYACSIMTFSHRSINHLYSSVAPLAHLLFSAHPPDLY